MKKYMTINRQWMMLIVFISALLAITGCAKKKSAGISPMEAQPAVTSSGHEMTEEELAAQHQKDARQRLVSHYPVDRADILLVREMAADEGGFTCHWSNCGSDCVQ